MIKYISMLCSLKRIRIQMIGGLGTTELIIILVIVLVIFGAGKLPEVGGAMGKGIRNFKRAAKGQDDIDVTPEQSGGSPEALEDNEARTPSGSAHVEDRQPKTVS